MTLRTALFPLVGLLVACPPVIDDDSTDDDSTAADDDSTGDDDTTGDDDVTGDDDTLPQDDDSTGDDDDSTPIFVTECVEPHGMSRQSIDLGGAAPAVLQIDFRVSSGVTLPDEDVGFEVILSNPGTETIDTTWDNCGYPGFTLLDAGGSPVWTGGEGEQINCLVPGTSHLEPGDSQTWAWSAPPPTAGFNEAQAWLGLALHAAGETDPGNGPTGWDAFGFTVTVPFVTTDFTGVCASPAVEASFLLGLELDFAASMPPLVAGWSVPVEGGAIIGDETLPGVWDNCGWPEWALYDASGTETWRWSDAYAADCSIVEELGANLEIRDEDELPGDSLESVGLYTAELNFRRVVNQMTYHYIVQSDLATLDGGEDKPIGN